MTTRQPRDFDTAALTWDDNPMRVALARAITQAMLDRVPVSPEMDALDYGAGTGLVTLGIQPHVRSITAADSSRGMLDKLNGKLAASGLANVQTALLDLEHEPAPEREFDLIISSMTFHHIEDVASLTKQLCRMLRPGGWLAVADLDLDDGDFHPDPAGVWHDGFDRVAIEQMFRDAGLLDVAIDTVHTMMRDVPGKGEREFSVFLASGRRGAV